MRLKNLLLSCLIWLAWAPSAALSNTFNDGVKAYQRAEYSKALQIWEDLAERGNTVAQMLAGSLYAYGEGTERNDKKAFYWFGKSAASGYARAQFNLAIMYEQGWGTDKDIDRAIYWYGMAAAQGRDDAKKKLDALTTRNNTATPGDTQSNKAKHVTDNAKQINKQVTQKETSSHNDAVNPSATAQRKAQTNAEALFSSQLNARNTNLKQPEAVIQVPSITSDTETTPAKQRIALLIDTKKPANGTSVKSNQRTVTKNSWLAQQDRKHFTIQLASHTDLNVLQSFIDEIALKENFDIIQRRRRNTTTYAVIYGSYADINAAQTAIESLPESWRRYVPWIRDIQSLQY